MTTIQEMPQTVAVAIPRGHRRRFNKHLRVFLAGTVDRATDNSVNRWAGKSLSIGIVLDQVVQFAARKGFKPDRSKSKKASSRSIKT